MVSVALHNVKATKDTPGEDLFGQRPCTPMTQAEFNTFCSALSHTTHVTQWGGADVWKIGGKVFAISWPSQPNEQPAITFKCSAFSFEILRDTPGCKPAPYFASRGLKWIQRTEPTGLPDDQLRPLLEESYLLVAAMLPKKKQVQLGLLTPIAPRAGARNLGTSEMSKTLTVWGLKNCDTCKKALKFLEATNHAVTFVDIRTDADLPKLVPDWLAAVGAKTLLNARSTTWRNLDAADRAKAQTAPAELLVANPALIKRPVISDGQTIHVGWSDSVQTALGA